MKNYLPFIITGITSAIATLILFLWLFVVSPGSIFHNTDSPDTAKAAAKAIQAVVSISCESLKNDSGYNSIAKGVTASGVIISDDGYVVTNYHVIAGSNIYHVLMKNGYTIDAKRIGADTTFDLALLKIDSDHLPYLHFGNSDALEVGQPVLAVGNPHGLRSTVTGGIIGALSKEFSLFNYIPERLIQTDVAINDGNSGGALVDSHGNLIGINAAMLTSSGQYEGISFAIPSNLVKKITDDLRQYGRTQTGYMGVVTRPVTYDIAQEEGMTEVTGLVADRLDAGGAADLAGIQSLDIILSVDGRIVDSNSEISSILDMHRPGDVIKMEIFRAGKKFMVSVKLTEGSVGLEE